MVEHYEKIADVCALARFSKKADRGRIEALGATVIAADLADAAAIKAIPDDFDYVLNFAVVKSGNFDYDLAANGEGVGNLMSRCHKARAILHMSSAGVYEYKGQEPLKESDSLCLYAV